MSIRALEIEGRADFSNAVRAFDDVGSGAADMAREVDRAADKVNSSASRLDRVGESADNLDSKAAQATGSLGALSSGFELVGAEGSKTAQIFGAAALATDTLAGVGEGLNLITQLTVVQKAKDIVVTRAQALASKSSAVATRGLAVATRVLNAAMRANPIGLVITAALLLGGLFVLLYKRSDRFRGIVQATGRAGKAALGWVVDGARDVVGWVGNRIPGGFRTVQRAAVLYFRLATLGPRLLIAAVRNVVDWVGKVPGKFSDMKNRAVDIASDLTRPFRELRDLVESIVGWIGRIDFPSAPKWVGKIPGLGRTVGGGGGGGGVVVGGNTTVVVNTTVDGIVDDATLRKIERASVNALRRVGVVRVGIA